MIISDLYKVSALAGSIETKGGLSRFINGFNKKRAYNKVCKNLDKITEYLSNTEIDDFIYVMSMYHKVNIPVKVSAPGNSIRVTLLSSPYKSIGFSFTDTRTNDAVYIKYDDGEISIAESYDKNEFIQYNSSNMGDFDFDPRKMMGTAVNAVMKDICKDLIYREEE